MHRIPRHDRILPIMHKDTATPFQPPTRYITSIHRGSDPTFTTRLIKRQFLVPSLLIHYMCLHTLPITRCLVDVNLRFVGWWRTVAACEIHNSKARVAGELSADVGVVDFLDVSGVKHSLFSSWWTSGMPSHN